MGGIRVVARIRPQQGAELDKDSIVSTKNSHGEDSSRQPDTVCIPSFKNSNESYSFQFSSVYNQHSTQQMIFENEIAPTIKHLFNGFDVTIFAYGVTGTGKTHTMRGGKSLADRGVIPRLLSSSYRRARKLEKDSEGQTIVGITLSYYEIYNDKVFDLLEAPGGRTLAGLHLRDSGGKTVVVGLTERPCESLKEFERLYDQANVNRSTSATKLNAHSSRSHAILCFKVTMTTGEDVRVSTASAIDLAGSEDNRRTENGKDRLIESASINKSLFVLAKCVEAISQQQTRIPYRESKMTRILSLGQNNGLTVMILNLAPTRSYHLDTISSLNFANRTKKIEMREVENEHIAKGCARAVPTPAGSTMHRQPLRPLSSTVHNTAVGVRRPSQQENKPAKTFSVYTDRSRRSFAAKSESREMTGRSWLRKHSLETDPSGFGRPAKRRSPDHAHQLSKVISKEVIEDFVEKKVADILAARALDNAPAGPVPEISQEVQRRLDQLEQKIDEQENGREQGLTYLLMAKQHSVRGENRSALRMFLLAKQYFPDNAKLTTKIERLQSKLEYSQTTKEERMARKMSIDGAQQLIQPDERSASGQECGESQRRELKPVVDDDYNDEMGALNDEYASDDSFRYRPKAHKARSKPTAKSIRQAKCIRNVETPRTERLLSIVNSRDVGQIRLLQGVGAKKAEAIVEALCGGEDVDGGCHVVIHNLGQLGHLRGVGVKTVEKMRSGLTGVSASQ
ncbi:MAG: hypothetical protein Q9220_004493 [cf. Caloplaca sp. 1 TL-2023]